MPTHQVLLCPKVGNCFLQQGLPAILALLNGIQLRVQLPLGISLVQQPSLGDGGKRPWKNLSLHGPKQVASTSFGQDSPCAP
jgi:hypothetical protein